MEVDKQWTIVKRVALFILLAFFLHLMVVWVVPDLSKPTRESFISMRLIDAADLRLEALLRKGARGGQGSDAWEDPPVQKIRDEVVFKRLSEMALSEERNPQPPLPKVSLFPAGELNEQEKQVVLENSRFYHELGGIVHGKEREKAFFDIPRPKIKDTKGGTIPLPEDGVAQRIISSLRETAKVQERAQKNTPEAAALDIRGPAVDRKISYIPPPLQSKLSVDGGCLLKFWVLPDGTVGKVIPLVQDDTQATVGAINQMKKYRFEPLPKGVPQGEMWGVIPVQSILR